MPKQTKEDWDAWLNERERWREYDSQGYQQDIKALEQHIATLLKVAPKDKAGWPNLNALDVINLLRKDLARAKAFFAEFP